MKKREYVKKDSSEWERGVTREMLQENQVIAGGSLHICDHRSNVRQISIMLNVPPAPFSFTEAHNSAWV